MFRVFLVALQKPCSMSIKCDINNLQITKNKILESWQTEEEGLPIEILKNREPMKNEGTQHKISFKRNQQCQTVPGTQKRCVCITKLCNKGKIQQVMTTYTLQEKAKFPSKQYYSLIESCLNYFFSQSEKIWVTFLGHRIEVCFVY